MVQNRTIIDPTSADEHRTKSASLTATGAKILQVEDILAGLPAHVMDELVEDMAEAVVAILLSQAAAETDEDEYASGDLR